MTSTPTDRLLLPASQDGSLIFNTASAQEYARQGRLEAWVHRYLREGWWRNEEFSEGLKRQPRWWRGPLRLRLTALVRAVGPEPEREYPVEAQAWDRLTVRYASGFTTPEALPPLIVECRSGELSVRDGNTRLGAMERLGWQGSWAIIWYSSEADYQAHSKQLAEEGSAADE
jgi:hypothetical protein